MTLMRYSLLRAMLLLGCLLTLWLVGVHDPFWLILLTGITSIALSYVVLRGPRDELARQLAARVGRRLGPEPGGSGVDEDVEDREDDARRGV